MHFRLMVWISREMSPSSRRAWIEIRGVRPLLRAPAVALLAEGVDRNTPFIHFFPASHGRPPRGGRG